jgi:hypothetical protein
MPLLLFIPTTAATLVQLCLLAKVQSLLKPEFHHQSQMPNQDNLLCVNEDRNKVLGGVSRPRALWLVLRPCFDCALDCCR